MAEVSHALSLLAAKKDVPFGEWIGTETNQALLDVASRVRIELDTGGPLIEDYLNIGHHLNKGHPLDRGHPLDKGHPLYKGHPLNKGQPSR